MPTNETLKTFKNSQANVLIRQEEILSETQDLSQVYAEDIAEKTATSLAVDDTFSSKEILKNLKDILESKIHGDSNFLKEAEIDALDVKTPTAIKQHKLERKERKARKKAYKNELKLIKQLEKKDTITAEEVKDVEKRLLALEGYANNSELNDLMSVKYQYLAEKNKEVEASENTDTLTNYYIKHSSLKNIYDNFDYDKDHELFNQKLQSYKDILPSLKDYNYYLPGNTTYADILDSYAENYETILSSDKQVHKRKQLMLLHKQFDSDKVLTELKDDPKNLLRKKIQRQHTLMNYGQFICDKKISPTEFNNELQTIFDSMISDFSFYIGELKKNISNISFKNQDDNLFEYLKDPVDLVKEITDLNSRFYARIKLSSDRLAESIEGPETVFLNKLEAYNNKLVAMKDFDSLLDLIKEFDEEITKRYGAPLEKYNSLSNYFRRIDVEESKKLSEAKEKIKPILKEKYNLELNMIDNESLREQIRSGKFYSEKFDIKAIIIN